jgi:glycine/D-amino acid oxidase-like deaminating enzyme
MHKEYLIVGGGLAGLFFAHELEIAGKSFMILDASNENSASKVAAGMFGPLGGQLSKLAWKAPEMLNTLQVKAAELEHKLGSKLIHWMPVQVAFGSIKDANDYELRERTPILNEHLSNTHEADKQVLAPFGCFEMLRSGWFNTSLFLSQYQKQLIEKESYQIHDFKYEDLVQTESGWKYGDLTIDKIVFAEGYTAANNPYVKNLLPFKLCKGQVLRIKCEGLTEEKIVKKGIYLIPLGDSIFKAGATYEWDEINEEPNAKGLQLMQEKIQNLITLPYAVLGQEAAIRPTTNDRNPVIGKVSGFENLFVLNGLGTKGVVRGPWLASLLFNSIDKNEPLPKEVSVERIKNKLEKV